MDVSKLLGGDSGSDKAPEADVGAVPPSQDDVGEMTVEDQPGEVRQFETGATRDTNQGKLDYEGFLSPVVLRRYAEYMHRHRFQSNGEIRDSDNWQKGIPVDAYMKSLHRHFMDLWLIHRGHEGVAREDLEEALCALLFNVQGILFEHLTREE